MIPLRGCDVDIGTGITREQYFSDIDPYLTRPLTLGGVRKRPRAPGSELKGLRIVDVQKRPSSAALATAQSKERARAKRAS